jgi:hypothetical protein
MFPSVAREWTSSEQPLTTMRALEGYSPVAQWPRRPLEHTRRVPPPGTFHT